MVGMIVSGQVDYLNGRQEYSISGHVKTRHHG